MFFRHSSPIMLLDRFHPAKGWPSGIHWSADTMPAALLTMLNARWIGHAMAAMNAGEWHLAALVAAILGAMGLVGINLLCFPKLSDLIPAMREVLCGTLCTVAISDAGDVYVRINNIGERITAGEVSKGDFSKIEQMPGIDLKAPGKHRRQLTDAVKEWETQRKAKPVAGTKASKD